MFSITSCHRGCVEQLKSAVVVELRRFTHSSGPVLAQVIPSWLGSVLLPNYPFTTPKLPVPINFCVHLFHSYLSAHSTVLFVLDGIL